MIGGGGDYGSLPTLPTNINKFLLPFPRLTDTTLALCLNGVQVEELTEDLFVNYDEFYINAAGNLDHGVYPLENTMLTSFPETVIDKMRLYGDFGTGYEPASIFVGSKIESLPIDFFERTIVPDGTGVSMFFIDSFWQSSFKSQSFNLTKFIHEDPSKPVTSIRLPKEILNRDNDVVITLNISSKYKVTYGRYYNAETLAPGDYSAERGYIYNQVD